MKVVSLVPSHTESLFELGFGGDVVGRTRFCIAPEEVHALPHVGGTKDASLERILALEPELVVADKDENPKALVDALEEHGVEVLWSHIDTVADAAGFLEVLASRMGDEEAGRRASRRIHATLAQVQPQQTVPVWCPIWYGPWMTFDATAYPHAMLEAVGLVNVFAGRRGPKYFEVDPSDVAQSGARWTLLPTEPYPFHKRLSQIDTAPLGPCGAPDRLQVIDGEALTWFGTRTARGLRALALVAQRLRRKEGH